jgi:hypothetical protein
VFRFKNYWLPHENVMPAMQHGWSLAVGPTDSAKRMMANFKNLRSILRCWYAQIPNLAKIIQNNKMVLHLLDTIEEHRDLSLEEWNFKQLVQENLIGLLEQQRVYWKGWVMKTQNSSMPMPQLVIQKLHKIPVG